MDAILAAEGLKVSAVQNHYSLLHRSSERTGILDYCKENGITFYSYMVLEQGALTGRYSEENPFPEGTGRGVPAKVLKVIREEERYETAV